jgi:hypothetical protein
MLIHIHLKIRRCVLTSYTFFNLTKYPIFSFIKKSIQRHKCNFHLIINKKNEYLNFLSFFIGTFVADQSPLTSTFVADHPPSWSHLPLSSLNLHLSLGMVKTSLFSLLISRIDDYPVKRKISLIETHRKKSRWLLCSCWRKYSVARDDLLL